MSTAWSCAWAEWQRYDAPASTHAYPIALDYHEAVSLALNVRNWAPLQDWLRKHGIGRGSVMVDETWSFVFYPPRWNGPEWTPELDRQWRALERLVRYSARNLRLSRARLSRCVKPLGRPSPMTLLSYSPPRRA